ncbi:hypothetical protein LTR53_018462, partial [Teratosphaeriaceae sp. CCFEE 6253]
MLTTDSPASEANNTTFLPELYSTPPMPTFQKPYPANLAPRSPAPLRPATPASTRGALDRDKPLPPLCQPPRHLSRTPETVLGPLAPTTDRIEDTPPLPLGWTPQHDLAICVLDTRNYTLPGIATKVRRTFPSLRGVLSAAMIDKRLRQLDQDVEIDYWRIGLRGGRADVGGGGGAGPSGGERLGRGVEPTVKATPSGSLLKSHSASNLLPDA